MSVAAEVLWLLTGADCIQNQDINHCVGSLDSSPTSMQGYDQHRSQESIGCDSLSRAHGYEPLFSWSNRVRTKDLIRPH